MNVFYDLETSGLDTKHQILTACFIVTDDAFNIEEVKNFRVALNPLEIPAESAIAVNAVDITKHMLHHKDRFEDLLTEEDFAKEVDTLLRNELEYNNSALIGYNSNKFDIVHLRKVLIKWGYNPYYNYNKFPMVDIYNHVRLLKLSRKKEFAGIENLKLGTIHQHFIKSKTKRALHEAETDVNLCIELAQYLNKKFHWDIVKENKRVNNISGMNFIPGDQIALANPYNEEQIFDICTVQDSTDAYVLLKKNKLMNEDDYPYSLVKKTDFKIGKHIGHIDIENPLTLNEYFATFEKKDGVENDIYSIKFKDFSKLYDVRVKELETLLSDSSNLSDLINSQIITRMRPIIHTEEGIVVDEISKEESKFIRRYFSQYGLGDNDVYEGNSNCDKVKLLKEYKAAYKELVNSLEAETF